MLALGTKNGKVTGLGSGDVLCAEGFEAFQKNLCVPLLAGLWNMHALTAVVYSQGADFDARILSNWRSVLLSRAREGLLVLRFVLGTTTRPDTVQPMLNLFP